VGRLMKSLVRVVPAGAAVLIGASLVAGCGGSGTGAQTFNVSIDGTNTKANETFLNYFPAQTKVHPGDKVVFTWNGPGEPHTVTFGTLVDSALSAFQALPPSQQENPPQSVIALDAKVPQLLPNLSDASQSAANPCYLASGTPPPTAACPSGSDKQPDFDGTQSYYNSGWGDTGDKFTVRVGDDTKPGTYQFMCLLHREGMIGKLTVADKSTAIPSPSDQQKLGEAQQKAIEAKLVAPLALLRQGKAPVPSIQLPGTNVVLAGSGSPDQSVTGSISEFGPDRISIPVGGSVTWWFIGPHSVTFGSDESNDDIRTTHSDGSVHLNSTAVKPAGGPGEPQKPPSGGSPTSPKFTVVASATWDGSGYQSSGVFVNSFGPPVIEGYTLKFTKAGTYKYVCTVHDDMKGTVVVGGG
jgi:plastocyanin